MMTEPPKSEGSEEICPMCRRPKSKHTPEEILDCSRKMREFKETKESGSGIE
jgi:hypothetical protein